MNIRARRRRLHRQPLRQPGSKAQPATPLAQPGQGRSRQGIETAPAFAATPTLQAMAPAPAPHRFMTRRAIVTTRPIAQSPLDQRQHGGFLTARRKRQAQTLALLGRQPLQKSQKKLEIIVAHALVPRLFLRNIHAQTANAN